MTIVFGDNFNIVDWINSNLAAPQQGTASDYEKAASSLLTKLQLQSRDESQTADQNIKALTSGLPQSMAKLSHIGSTVDELSESLRNLTNSGYKFKSGNIPDKIGELSSLKSRRDRLRESGEIIKNGIRIESDIQQLQQQCNTGPLKDICAQYIRVSQASSSLKLISKFESLNKNLQSIKQTIEERLKHLMLTACSAQNASSFIENSNLAKQISSEGLEMEVATQFISSRIKSIHNNYNSGDLELLDWVQPCYKDCLQTVVEFSNWCLSLTPHVFTSRIHDQFIQIISTGINPSIESQCNLLLKDNKFDKIVDVINALEDSWAQIPPSWYLPEKSHQKLLEGLKKTKTDFITQYKSYLEAQLSSGSPVLPKSNTSDSLKQPPGSPMKQSTSSMFDTLTMPVSTSGFDTKLPEFVQIAKKSLNWASHISTDISMCIRLSSSFLSIAINGASKEILNNLAKLKVTTSQNDDASKIKASIQAYKTAKEQLVLIDEYESSCLALSPTASHSSSENSNKMIEQIEKEVINAMAAPSLRLLEKLKSAPEWAEDNDLSDVDLGDDESISIPIQESLYISGISRSIFEIIKLLTNDSALTDETRSEWMNKTTDLIAKSFLLEITAIPSFSESGCAQLRTDLAFINQMLETLGLSFGKDIEDVNKIVSAKPSQRQKLLANPDVSKLISVSLSKSLGIKK
ncbi:hypothetical protein TVAG_473920 [Trichomonas vaginalis G3]|uniref:Conserved oligomeric Golgi complex subunit 7 n=1 Tax=Trichomonas vaginalis (strain ATCC PRA-98 / G3) TaxID=412133 RepID=A2EQ38_TRIV3|nr:conserved oligomeric Golgi complex component 7 family [Trichomonas vaginalis G3]EAY05213.1 hypothetical protein TVAG_473920 [Trichomonas vaginalis G3]KAI5542620.1 conserved oligomeric Golgi complex component 7 family [Trichomonas vaginalis G3]|eukprot:XP_001317436.1 hypothetical protein [Trichomonas vaginalis G3]